VIILTRSYPCRVNFFKDAGEVVEVRFAMRDDRFAGYGHVEFATVEAAQKACYISVLFFKKFILFTSLVFLTFFYYRPLNIMGHHYLTVQ